MAHLNELDGWAEPRRRSGRVERMYIDPLHWTFAVRPRRTKATKAPKVKAVKR